MAVSMAEERKRVTLSDLIYKLDEFITDNKHSRDEATRWFAAELEATLQLSRQLRSGLGPEERAKVNAFRAKELEAEIERKRKDTEALERELKKLRAA
ncbi:hypothetical protein [Bradyrhizobium sp. SZCCHNRI1073]|uniref:hypothetical protein n=1 Tax=Bradyrhizobium sp. SZCCHNRI1073 TaxID=3057280 RepID=UPI0029163A21|nr:hypothetical protein [Bradyrhizobium sp. SZCCHNRI1073]